MPYKECKRCECGKNNIKQLKRECNIHRAATTALNAPASSQTPMAFKSTNTKIKQHFPFLLHAPTQHSKYKQSSLPKNA